MEWRLVHSDPPEDGQKVYYFGPNIGLWVGTYAYTPDRKVEEFSLCPHVFKSEGGVCDACDAPQWAEFNPEREAKGWRPLMPQEYWSPDLSY
jgi:hypothetical protein